MNIAVRVICELSMYFLLTVEINWFERIRNKSLINESLYNYKLHLNG